MSLAADLLAQAELQQARHSADYDVAQKLTRREAERLVAQVQRAFQAWQTVRADPATRVYLAALLLWKQWSR